MRRRDVIAAVGGAAALWTCRAGAETAPGGHRIGVLMGYSKADPEAPGWINAFLDGLAATGWIPGRSLHIDYRWEGEDVARMSAYAHELLELSPDVIFVATNPATYAVKEATRAVPIVFAIVPDPVGAGFISSLAEPGGNITGFTNLRYTMASKWLEILKEFAPEILEVAVLYDPRNPSSRKYWAAAQRTSQELNVTLIDTGGTDIAMVERAVDKFAHRDKRGLMIFPTPLTTVHRNEIIAWADRARLPAVYPVRYFAASGGLISYGAKYRAIFRRAAAYVDRILRGGNPGLLPVQQPNTFELVINLKAARALGRDVPPTLLARADELIE